jgi:hypothetical protein
MGKKLFLSTALFAAALAAGSCEKTPNGEPAAKQTGSTTPQDQQEAMQAPEPGSLNSSQSAPGHNEHQGNQDQERQRQRAAEDLNSNSEANQDHATSNQGQADQGDRTSSHSQTSAQSGLLPSGSHSVEGGGNSAPGADGAPVPLRRDQVRQLQIVLKEKGFDVGKTDGIIGPRTRNALIAFQRQQGIQATGQIDQRTITALGMPATTSTTSGQSGAGTQ